MSPTIRSRKDLLLYLMGLSQLFPVAFGWNGRDFLVLHLLFWLPAGFYLCTRDGFWDSLRSLAASRLFLLCLLYFAWGLLSGGSALFLGSSAGVTGVRLLSLGALLVYAVFPLLIGLAIGRGVLAPYARGAAIGLLGSALAWVGIHFYLLFYDPESLRLAIGQRIPLVLVFALPLLIAANVASFRFRLGLVFLLTLVIWLSMTRAALLGWSVVVALSLVGLAVRNRGEAIKIAVAIIPAIVLSMSSSFMGARLVSLASWSYSEVAPAGIATEDRVATNDGEVRDDSAATRLLIWKAAIASATESPSALLFGHGQLGAPHLLPPIRDSSGGEIAEYSAHSEYFDQLLRGGIVGLILLIAISLELVREGWLTRRATDVPSRLRGALAVATVGALIYGVFHETTRYPWFAVVYWTCIGVSLAGGRFSRPNERAGERS